MSTVIYHNPRCSKSRATLALLTERGIEPEIVDYLKTPPSLTRLKAIRKLLGVEAPAMMRLKESIAKELGLAAGDDRSNDEWLALVAEHPKLLERPIVVVDDRAAAIGRPPESVLSILG